MAAMLLLRKNVVCTIHSLNVNNAIQIIQQTVPAVYKECVLMQLNKAEIDGKPVSNNKKINNSQVQKK